MFIFDDILLITEYQNKNMYNNNNNNNNNNNLLCSQTATLHKVCPTLIFLSDVVGAMTGFIP